MIRVADLVADSSLNIEVLSGHEGLTRPVTWAHVAEIPDAAQWLEGGELLFTTGLGIPADPDDQVRYLESLANVEIAALAIGHRTPKISEEFFATSDRFNLPVVRIGVEVPFSAVSRIVAASNLDRNQHRLALQVRILESLRWWAESQVDTATVFKRLETVTGFAIYITDEEGVALLPGMRNAPAGLREEIPTLRSYPIIRGGFGAQIPVTGQQNAFVVLQQHEDESATGVVVARQVATVAAVHLADHYRRLEEELRRDSELLSGLLSGEALTSSGADHLEGRGLDLTEPLRVVALCDPDGARINIRDLYTMLHRKRLAVVPHSTTDHVVMLTTATVEDLSTVICTSGFVGGVSEPFHSSEMDLRRSHRQAIWAMHNADERDAALVPYACARKLAPWLNMSAETIATIVEQVLGPVSKYDRTKGSELMHTLEVFLEEDRSIGKAAQMLFIHPHTLRYRLDKIEQLTSKSFARTQDIAEFWWALQARKIPT